MKTSKLISLKEHKILKAILGTAGVLIIGGLGNGVWELFLKSTIEWLGNSFLQIMSFTFQGYSNMLHSTIGKGTEAHTAQSYAFTLIIILMMFWGVWLWMKVRAREYTMRLSKLKAEVVTLTEEQMTEKLQYLNKRVEFFRKVITRVLTPLLAIFTILCFSNIIEINYTFKACIYIERSIEILAPKISPEKVLDLRAKYRLIDNAEKFDTLSTELEKIAIETNSTLPAFKMIE